MRSGQPWEGAVKGAEEEARMSIERYLSIRVSGSWLFRDREDEGIKQVVRWLVRAGLIQIGHVKNFISAFEQPIFFTQTYQLVGFSYRLARLAELHPRHAASLRLTSTEETPNRIDWA
jgi:hypothetical protein